MALWLQQRPRYPAQGASRSAGALLPGAGATEAVGVGGGGQAGDRAAIGVHTPTVCPQPRPAEEASGRDKR